MQLPDGKTVKRLRIETRIQVPKGGPGLWSAFWMQVRAGQGDSLPVLFVQQTFWRWQGTLVVELLRRLPSFPGIPLTHGIASPLQPVNATKYGAWPASGEVSGRASTLRPWPARTASCRRAMCGAAGNERHGSPWGCARHRKAEPACVLGSAGRRSPVLKCIHTPLQIDILGSINDQKTVVQGLHYGGACEERAPGWAGVQQTYGPLVPCCVCCAQRMPMLCTPCWRRARQREEHSGQQAGWRGGLLRRLPCVCLRLGGRLYQE